MTPKTLAHVDTSILLAILGHGKLDSIQKRTINKILSRHTFRIPQVVLGESFAVAFDRNPAASRVSVCTNMLTTLNDKLDLATDRFPPPSSGIIKIASELCDLDNNIKNMDSLILAHSIADNESAHFYTDDRAMQSGIIQDYVDDCIANNIRDQKLNILECFKRS